MNNNSVLLIDVITVQKLSNIFCDMRFHDAQVVVVHKGGGLNNISAVYFSQ